MTGRGRVEGGGQGYEDRDAREWPLARFTVHEAALYLGLSVDAVRKRADRGTLRKEKDADGTVYILLSMEDYPVGREASAATGRSAHGNWSGSGRTENGGAPRGPDDRTADSSGDRLVSGRDELATSLGEQVAYLRGELEVRNEELRRKDHLLAAALERVPRIEAPAGEWGREAAGGGPNDSPNDSANDSGEGAEPRSWWRRLFVGS